MGVRLNDQTVSGASKISFTFHVWYRSLILDDVKLAELSNNSCESNNVTYIPVGQNILWPFLRISGVKTSQPPGYTPTDTFKRNLKTHLSRLWLNFCSAIKTELALKSDQPQNTVNRVEGCCHIQETHTADTVCHCLLPTASRWTPLSPQFHCCETCDRRTAHRIFAVLH